MNVAVRNVYLVSLADLEVPEGLLRQLRRADDFIRLGVAAANSVLENDSGGITAPGDRTGLFLGSAFGPMQTNFEVLDQVVESEPVSPTLFSHSVFNTAAGYMANILNISGCAMIIADFGFPFFRALEQGILAIRSGRLDSCLVLQVETYSELLQDVKLKQVPGEREWEPGAVCWLLEKQTELRGAQYIIDDFEIRSGCCTGISCLQMQERVSVGMEVIDTAGFIGAVSFLTGEAVKGNLTTPAVCTVDSAYGSVKVCLK